MSESRLRIRFGEHEFEVEGPADHVERQFEAFRRMVVPEPAPPMLTAAVTPVLESLPPPPAVPENLKPSVALEKIMNVKGRMVSLSVNAKIDEAILTIILGQHHFRQNQSVSGMEIMSGLRASGLDVPRSDGILGKYARDGIVVAMGRRKLRRYRLSTDGIARAEQIAQSLISRMP